MERVFTIGARNYVRSGLSKGAKRCLGQRNCYSATTRLTSSRHSRIPSTLPLMRWNPIVSLHRYYSTPATTASMSPSTPLGTIADGAAGTSTPSSDHTLTTLLAPSHLDENEKEIFEMLSKELQPTELEVKDISGGCGSMYGIEVESEKFRGLGMLKQQRMVNAVLKAKMERENWHGVQLKTRIPTS